MATFRGTPPYRTGGPSSADSTTTCTRTLTRRSQPERPQCVSRTRVDGSTVEAIDLQPEQQLRRFRSGRERSLAPDDQASFDQLHKLVGDADHTVALAKLRKGHHSPL